MKRRITALMLLVFISLMSVSAFAGGGNYNIVSYYREGGQAATNVDTLAYRCTDSTCTTDAGFVNSYNSGATNVNYVNLPDTAQTTWYAVFHQKACYIPWVSKRWSYGSGATLNTQIDFYKEPICKSLIDSFSVTNEVHPNQPVMINFGADLDATTNSAFTLGVDDLVEFVRGDMAHYSVDTRVTLRIYNSSNQVVYTESKDFTLFADTSENAQFSWTPTQLGEYRAELTTDVTDCQCAQSIPQSTSKTFRVVAQGAKEYCYTILNDVSINNDNVVEPNDPLIVSATKISNKVNDFGILTSLPTDVSVVVKKNGLTVHTDSKTVSANANTNDTETFSFDAGVLGFGDYEVTVTAQADNCPYVVNDAETSDVVFISIPKVDRCGDGVVDETEQCDDGNTDNNDGCNEFCEYEFCGDGIVQTGEMCDDGNNIDDDGCSNDCTVRECTYDYECSDELFCNGEEVCNPETHTCEPGEEVQCDNGLYCDGMEVCDEHQDACVPGEPVVCTNGLYCDGEEVCDEGQDTCVPGEPVVCDNGLWCDGTEVCNENTDSCDEGNPVVCDNGLFCDGEEVCNEDYDRCDDGEPVICDNGLFCDGEEVCDESQDKCVDDVDVDCSHNDITGIDTCFNNPDLINETRDYRVEFISECVEETESCTEGDPSIDHYCDYLCGADVVCQGKNPGEGPCDENCMVECTMDSDCDNGLYCDGMEVCDPQTYTCEPGEPVACDNGLWCDGTEACDEYTDSCKPGTPVECDNGLFCDGLETCNEDYDRCDPGVDVDCSYNDITGIDTCFNDPDGVNETRDFRVEFISVCDEDSDVCTEGNPQIWHECDYLCGADVACHGKNPGEDGCDDNCQMRECTYDHECSDGLFCNGEEVCDQQTYTCEPGTPVTCDNGLYCDGVEVCDEKFDRCETGEPVVCDNGLFCDGQELCNENLDKCESHYPPQCDDGLFCNGEETCDEYQDKCVDGDPVVCDDGLYCNGLETCDEYQDKCVDDVDVDCSHNDITGIDTCFNDPDGVNETRDFRVEFVSECVEATDSCTEGDPQIWHECDYLCGADVACHGKNPGEDGCDDNCQMRECTYDHECSDGLFCNGEEVCDQQTYTCEPGEVVQCDNGLYCDGVEVCDEKFDRCESGTPVVCDNELFCDGVEVCNEYTDSCDEGTPVVCDNGLWCDGSEICNEQLDKCEGGHYVPQCDDGLFCNGEETCDEYQDKCVDGSPVVCDDGLYCNGLESCDEYQDKCVDDADVDCSHNDIDEVYSCVHDPDNNDYTMDLRDEFISECVEATDSCSEGDPTITHACDVFCGADGACHGKNPGQDGCDDNCQMRECTYDSDCDNGLYCDGYEVCNEYTYTCEPGEPVVCDNGLYCDGVEVCNEYTDSCDEGTPVVCDNGLWCDGSEICNEQTDSCEGGHYVPECDDGLFCNGEETCDEYQDKCVDGSPVVCNDGLYCNGVEVCDEYQNKCVDGTEVDCSANDIDEVYACDHDPDNNDYTMDLRDEFISECVEATDSCSEGSTTITHACDVFCGADGACHGKNPGQDGCDENCQMRECYVDADCNNGLYCDGIEYCNQQTYTCEPGTPVVCDNGLFCDGVEVCDEYTDSCKSGTPIQCDNGKFCDGSEVCNEQTDSCEGGHYVPQCDDGLFCNGEETCDEYQDKCVDGTPVQCDNGLYCDGVEVCDEYQDKCVYGQDVDCSAYNIPGINVCDNNPDNNDYTKDFRQEFISSCDERTDSCTIGNDDIEHACDVAMCGAECSDDSQCADSDCDYLDGCYGTYYLDFDDRANTCTDGCGCTDNQCKNPAIYPNDDRCIEKECTTNADCDNGLYCDGSEVCNLDTYTCEPGTPVACDNGLFCDGEEVCNEYTDSCDAGTPVVCDNGLFCDGVEVCNEGTDSCDAGTPVACDDGIYCNGLEICDEYGDQCVTDALIPIDDGISCTVDECHEDTKTVTHTPQDSLCDNGLFCDGVETCDQFQGCQAGLVVDCSANDIDGIDTCDNDPDNNLVTRDYRSSFVSVCDDSIDSCTVGDDTITHTCDDACGADIACDGVAPGTNGCTNTCVAKECTKDADCDNGLFCDGQEVCNLDTYTCEAGTPIDPDDGISCTVDSCDEDQDQVVNEPNHAVCDNGLYCDGVEVCDTTLGCVDGTLVDCSANDIDGVDTCDHNPDLISTTKDYRVAFDSVCDEGTDSCTVGDNTITHTCDELICGADSECDGVAPNTNDCSFECKYKPPVVCEHDGQYSNDMSTGTQYVCKTDNTYYECNSEQTAYVHVNMCSFECSADLACDGAVPGSSLEACDIAGKDYLEDYCDDTCQLQESNCESSFAGCTAEPSCDEQNPGEGGCSDTCQMYECTTDADCDDGLFCNGVETCDEFSHTCQGGSAPACDDGLYCNGVESCDEDTDSCGAGVAVDCSAYDIDGVNSCTHDPDNVNETLDYRDAFVSVCNEATDSCTTGDDTITHACSLMCGAECTSDAQCSGTTCEDQNGCYLNGVLVDDKVAECFGETGCEERTYESASGFCDLATCGCTDSACTMYEVNVTDMDGDGYDAVCDMDCDDTNPDVHPGAYEVCNGIDDDCDGDIDEGLYGGDFRISYGTRNTGDIITLNGYSDPDFVFERIDFFHGYVHVRNGKPFGFGSLAGRATLENGTKVKINVKFDVEEIIDRNCVTVTWRNSARGTWWIEGVGTVTKEWDYMDITYNLLTGEIDAIGVGEIDFEFEDMIDNKFVG